MLAIDAARELLLDSSSGSEGSEAEDMRCSKVKMMLSYGGRILPKRDGQLGYTGGESRIVVIRRGVRFQQLIAKLARLIRLVHNPASAHPQSLLQLKYQLPNEDLDALISVTCDEDVSSMMEEHDKLMDSDAKIRAFLFLQHRQQQQQQQSSPLLSSKQRGYVHSPKSPADPAPFSYYDACSECRDLLRGMYARSKAEQQQQQKQQQQQVMQQQQQVMQQPRCCCCYPAACHLPPPHHSKPAAYLLPRFSELHEQYLYHHHLQQQ